MLTAVCVYAVPCLASTLSPHKHLQVLEGVKGRIEAVEKTIATWSEEKPWINENETKSAVEKVRVQVIP